MTQRLLLGTLLLVFSAMANAERRSEQKMEGDQVINPMTTVESQDIHIAPNHSHTSSSHVSSQAQASSQAPIEELEDMD